MTVVVDASLALKWVLEEEYTEKALALRDQWRVTGQAVIAPSIFRSEVTNALHQSSRQGHLSRSDAAEALDILLSLVAIRDPIELYSRALVLAGDMALGSTYDALYVALAESEGCDMWTARTSDCAPRHAAWDTRLNREKFGGDFWANRPTLKRKPKRKTACR